MGTTFEFEVSDGRKVELKELSGLDLNRCIELSGGGEKPWDMSLYGLRLAIAKDRGKPVVYTDLLGPALLERFTARELLVLQDAWKRINAPSEEDLARVRAMKVVAG